jgi:hypothetical protein
MPLFHTYRKQSSTTDGDRAFGPQRFLRKVSYKYRTEIGDGFKTGRNECHSEEASLPKPVKRLFIRIGKIDVGGLRQDVSFEGYCCHGLSTFSWPHNFIHALSSNSGKREHLTGYTELASYTELGLGAKQNGTNTGPTFGGGGLASPELHAKRRACTIWTGCDCRARDPLTQGEEA